MCPDRVLLGSSGAALLALAACSPDIDEPTVGCEKLADCPLGEVCDLPQRQCIPEPANRILGRFSCDVTDDLEQEIRFPGAELIALVESTRVVLSIGTTCWISSGTMNRPTMHLLWTDPTDTFGFTLDVDGTQAANGGRLAIGPYVPPSNSGALVHVPRDQYVATTVGGFIDLPPVAVGRTIEGYVDLQMIEVIPERGLAGVPCPRGQADCGRDRDIDGPFATFCFSGPPVPAYCTRACDFDSECAALGDAICAKSGCAPPECRHTGLCLQPCNTNADCIAPLECILTNAEPRKVCH